MQGEIPIGSNIALLPVELNDAAFLVKLRTSASARIGLRAGATSEAGQREWLRAYFDRAKLGLEHYFLILYARIPVGAVRIYNICRDRGEFTWGSWVIQEGTDPSAAWLSVVAIYDFAFDELQQSLARFEVVAQNGNVLRFHRAFGATVTRQTAAAVELSVTKEQYKILRPRFLRLLENASGRSGVAI